MDLLPEVTQRSYEQARRNRLFLEALGTMRESKGISQDLVAQRLGVTPEWVSELESGVINPTLQRLHSYAVDIGVAIEYNVRDLDVE
ncbi:MULTISPECIES: helix-turn-helix domain-containing protein [Actinotignum]|uniref:Helix-turn-helix transcriptional regulator n=1 Tax=Actinotignum timonense TaxID=1870995 RepID=A0AAW9HG02_9ACTO|nr:MULTISPECIES: helix-turn-helix transcriptional regulator [Actinotignum]MBS5749231.1 helix-turn-helix transcriptional regulator [Actinotignum schaalii]MDE1558551.1 helix-turn-helix transcriptional regulator [Actinotignum schaalii]MDE1663407.1 helix-turn-helix transcriptional regulator [Actinotignum schaalii]MDK6372715.1 helix-turn-helix transcriptional regulator [Actinotignum timonense]MDK6419607.1 helix-turn-helix transcriptional regulator [Actinotignum timonense]